MELETKILFFILLRGPVRGSDPQLQDFYAANGGTGTVKRYLDNLASQGFLLKDRRNNHSGTGPAHADLYELTAHGLEAAKQIQAA